MKWVKLVASIFVVCLLLVLNWVAFLGKMTSKQAETCSKLAIEALDQRSGRLV